mgnify:CR=1 FL=1
MTRPLKLPTLSREIHADVRRSLQMLADAVTAAGGSSATTTAVTLAQLSSVLTGTGASALLDMRTPPQPGMLMVVGGYATIVLEWDPPEYANHAYTDIFRSESDDFATAEFVGRTPAQVYVDTPPTLITSQAYYYWIRFVSLAGVSGPLNATDGTAGSTADDPSYLLELLTERIGYAQFDTANGVFPVRVVEALPTLPDGDWPAGSYASLTTNGKLYKTTDGETWGPVVHAADLEGMITNAQIETLAASKVTGQLSNDQIAAIAAAKITGQLVDAQLASLGVGKLIGEIRTTQIANDAITTAKIAAGAVTADEIAALAITAAKIAANTITAAQIAAGTITADEIAANAVTVAKIAAGAVTTAKLAAGAVTANEIAANTITAAQIAALAITAAEIAADAVTAGKIAAGAILASHVGTNEIIASAANIKDAIITSAKIASLTTDKLVAGTTLIGAALIGTAAIQSAHITDLSVDTIKIANNAVTVPVYAATTSAVDFGNGSYVEIVSLNISVPATAAPVLVTCSGVLNVHSLVSSSGNSIHQVFMGIVADWTDLVFSDEFYSGFQLISVYDSPDLPFSFSFQFTPTQASYGSSVNIGLYGGVGSTSLETAQATKASISVQMVKK